MRSIMALGHIHKPWVVFGKDTLQRFADEVFLFRDAAKEVADPAGLEGKG
ncbi:MAG: hypothetical protein ACLT3Y_00080 [Ruminococcus callidus]